MKSSQMLGSWRWIVFGSMLFHTFGVKGDISPLAFEDSYWEKDAELLPGTERPLAVFSHRFMDRFSIAAKAQASQSKETLDLSSRNDTSRLNEAPPTENGDPIKVDISVLIMQVRDIKELTEEITLELNLRMYWKDPRLNYLTSEDGQKKKFVAVSLKLLDKLWYPDIYLDHVKSVAQPSIIMKPASLRVYSDSTVRYSARFTIVMSCPMDFHMYPADTQKCSVDMKSYAFTSKILDLKWAQGRGAFLVDKLELPNFGIGLDKPENFTIETTSGSYAGVRFKVVLRRKLSYHLLQTYFPSMLFVTVSWLSFLVPPESVPARMTLSMTTLLTLSSMFSSIRSGIPSVSYIKALDIWMVTCVLFVWLTLVEYAVVLKFNNMKRVPKPGATKLSPPPALMGAPTPTPTPTTTPAPMSQFRENLLRSSIESMPEESDLPAPVSAIYNPTHAQTKQISGSSPELQGTYAYGNSTDSYEALNLSNKVSQFRHRFFRTNTTSPLPLLGMNANANVNGHAITPTPTSGAPTPGPLPVQGAGGPDPTSYKPLVLKIEQYTSAIIPTLFLVFNLCYWPWLLQALNASDDETVYYHL